ncbi:MAG: multi-sensor signal transduction histidine kinase [Bacillota bacterium]|jgi:polar amino acid transport system substrate-binding protein|nr:multi-sensor signal transduction histidine kinase [Bacillota bacterium]
MNRNLAYGTVIGILILIMVIYNILNAGGELKWGEAEKLYPLNPAQKEWLLEKKELVIGVSDDLVPLLTIDESGEPEGLLNEYLKRISTGYQISIRYQTIPVKERRNALEEGRVDAVITVRDNTADQSLEYTMPMVKTKGILLIRKEAFSSKKENELKVLIAEGSAAHSVLKRQLPEENLLLCGSIEEAVNRALLGEGDAIAGSEAALTFYLGRAALDSSWERASGYVYEQNECLAVKKGNSVLYDILNHAVYHTDNERVISELQGKWTGISYPLYVENKLEGLGIIIIIIFTSVLCVFFLFYQSNKSLYEELQQRMELLVESQNEMQTTFDGVTFYLAELNRNGTLISINRALSQYLCMKRHKAVGLRLETLLGLDQNENEKFASLVTETFQDEEEKDDEILVGTKTLEVHTFLIKNNKEQVQKILIMMIDVTEARSNERQLLQNHKMIAVGQLAAGVAHEIRNPLGLIRNYCYVLKEIDYRDYITRDEAIAVIEKSVDKSSRIIDNLLNFSRLSTNKKETVNLQAHLGAILDLQHSLLVQRKISLGYEYGGGHIVMVNVEAMELILINLITNAVDAICNEGEIKVSCCQDGQSVQLTVSDNGSGIPPEIMDEIYNPFFTTKKKREGNGLGLYIVYNEVQKMGGEIKAESDVGRGTTFYIRIPIENGGRQDEQKRTQSTGSR